MSIRKKNEQALKKFQKEFYKNYEENISRKSVEHCVIECCENNENIICRLVEQREWRLNSIYDPDQAAALYAERYREIADYAVLCIFGLADGRAVRRLLENCNGTQMVFIYEPDWEVFLAAIEFFDLSDIIENEQVYLNVKGINEKDIPSLLENLISFQNRTLMVNSILPNYDILYTEDCQNYIEKLLYYSKSEAFKKNTEVECAARFGHNILRNLPYILKGSSVEQLEQTFRNMDLSDTAAIIVSAGPSLDKNIKDLKKADGRAFIIGVDSALKALVREEIHFQMAVSVDPRKNPDVFADERVNCVPYALASYALPLIVECNQRKLFFEDGYGFSVFEKMISTETGKALGTLRTGGSVATEALSLALDMGFKNVILVGQDLAFTGGKGHVSGFEKDAATDKAHVDGRAKVRVEAIGGGVVETDLQMDSYRKWFEMRIEEAKGSTKVYNASAGGAHIAGAEEITLSEALERLCKKEIDYDAIVASIPPTFTDEEQRHLAGVLMDSEHELQRLEQRLKDGVAAYDALIHLEDCNETHTPEYKDLLQKVYEINGIEEQEPYMNLIKLYAKGAEYDAAGDIYVAEDLSVRDISMRGKRLLEGYLEGLCKCRTEMKEELFPALAEGWNLQS